MDVTCIIYTQNIKLYYNILFNDSVYNSVPSNNKNPPSPPPSDPRPHTKHDGHGQNQ